MARKPIKIKSSETPAQYLTFPTVKHSNVRDILLREMKWKSSIDTIWAQLVNVEENIGEQLATIIGTDPDPNLVQLAVVLIFYLASNPEEDLADIHPHKILKKAGPMLLRFLKDQSFPDEKKLLLVPLLKCLYPEISDAELIAGFHDIDVVKKMTTEKMASVLSTSPIDTIEVMMDAGYIDQEASFVPDAALTSSLLDWFGPMMKKNPDPVIAIICSWAAHLTYHRLPVDEILPVLDQIAQYPSPLAVWYLTELSHLPAIGPVGIKAGYYARQMLDSGINPSTQEDWRITKVRYTQMDGDETSSFYIYVKPSDSPSTHVFSLLFNERIGIKNTMLAWDGACQVDMRLSNDDFFCQNGSLDHARQMVAHNLYLHKQYGTPVPGEYLLFRPFLGSEPIEPCQYQPDLSLWKVDQSNFDPSLVHQSIKLIENPLYNFYFCSETAYDFIKSNAIKNDHDYILPDWQITNFLTQIVPGEIDALLYRIAFNLELASKSKNKNKPVHRIAAHTWLAMSQKLIPPAEIEYIDDIARASIDMMLSDLACGFSSQQEAKQAALEDSWLNDDVYDDDIEDNEDDLFSKK